MRDRRLFLHLSNRIEVLATHLARKLSARSGDPLSIQTVMVHSRGTARWLSMQIAAHNGISMGVRYPFPRAVVDELMASLLEGRTASRRFSPDPMSWWIFDRLPGLLDRPEFETIRRYLDGGDAVRRFHLAQRTAALFDQYQCYRPQMLASWQQADGSDAAVSQQFPDSGESDAAASQQIPNSGESDAAASQQFPDSGGRDAAVSQQVPDSGESDAAASQRIPNSGGSYQQQAGSNDANRGEQDGGDAVARGQDIGDDAARGKRATGNANGGPQAPGGDASAWQAQLWRELKRDCGERDSFVDLLESAARVKDSALSSLDLPECLHVFGINTLPPAFLQILWKVAAVTEVNFYLTAPTDQYWGDLVSRKKLPRDENDDSAPGNPLLATMGRLSRDLLEQLVELGFQQAFEHFEHFESMPSTGAEAGSDAGVGVIAGANAGANAKASAGANAEMSAGAAASSGANVEAGAGSQTGTYAGIRPNMIAAVQDDFYHLRDSSKSRQRLSIAADDSSIVVNCCHNPMRELEVLNDYLLALFAEDQTLLPRDILVLTPDIETYAPFVEAVFGSPESETLRIPYSLADRNPRSQFAVVDAFLRVLELSRSRFEATAVMSTLECEPLRRRFRLSGNDLSRIRRWIIDCGVVWAIDADHRERLGFAPDAAYSWKQARETLLYGLAMNGSGRRPQTEAGNKPQPSFLGEAGAKHLSQPSFPGEAGAKHLSQPSFLGEAGAKHLSQPSFPGEADAGNDPQLDLSFDPAPQMPSSERGPRLFNGILPYQDMEGAQRETLSRFLDAFDLLRDTALLFRNPRRRPQWVTALQELATRLFGGDPAFAAELATIQATLAALSPDVEEDPGQAVDPEVILLSLQRSLSGSSSSGSFLDGRATFCSLKPMRSIPSRVVCLLGMNDGAFPRLPTQAAFDLMASKPAPGDRSIREDDRHAFFETLMAVRERLYISFCGQSPKDLAQAPPSVLVCELLDYLKRGFDLPVEVEERLERKHRLQAFSRVYFEAGPMQSFSAANAAAARNLQKPPLPRPPFMGAALPVAGGELRQVNLASLTRFFANPARALCETRLDLRIDRDPETLPIYEPMELDPLSRYKLQQQLVDASLSAGPSMVWEAAQARGKVPPGAPGRAVELEIKRSIEQFVRVLRERLPIDAV